MIRTILATAVLALGVNALAAAPAVAPAAPTGPNATVPSTAPAATTTTTTTTQTETKAMVPGKKMAANGAYAKAKEECLAKDAGLKGKELRKCIKEKKAAK